MFNAFAEIKNNINLISDFLLESHKKTMKLPVIKHLTQFIEDNDEDFVVETIETLEALTEVPSLKDEELDVIGELISNMYGAIEVNKMTKSGTPKKEALNNFMSRVMGSIDK